jgi:hypothetical protein
MLVGNRWVERTRLKILNGQLLPVGAAWADVVGAIQTNLSERGFLVGFSVLYGAAGASRVDFQIVFDGQPAHQGFFRANFEPVAPVWMGNFQPTTMSMPHLDIPENTEVTVRARVAAGGGFNLFLDLCAVVYYVKDWDAAVPAVCFPTDVVPPGQV